MKQRGFTLLELLLYLAVGTVILSAAVSSIYQVVHGGWQVTKTSIALNDIDNTVHWLTRDIPMAQQVTGPVDDGPATTNITLTCMDLTAWAADEGTVLVYVSYNLTGTQLKRYYGAEEPTVVGKYLTYVGFSVNSTAVNVTLTASPSGQARDKVTRKYLIYRRAQ